MRTRRRCPPAYPLALRWRIVRAYDTTGATLRELATQFAVAPSTVHSYLKLRAERGTLAPRRRGPKACVDPQHLDDLRRMTREIPDATLAALAEAFASRHHIEVSRWTIARTLRHARRAPNPRSGA